MDVMRDSEYDASGNNLRNHIAAKLELHKGAYDDRSTKWGECLGWGSFVKRATQSMEAPLHPRTPCVHQKFSRCAVRPVKEGTSQGGPSAEQVGEDSEGQETEINSNAD